MKKKKFNAIKIFFVLKFPSCLPHCIMWEYYQKDLRKICMNLSKIEYKTYFKK